MLTAVELDNQVPFDATQIREIRTNAVLSAEFKPVQALSSEMLPQLRLLLRRVATKPSPAIFGAFSSSEFIGRAPQKAR